MGRPAQTDGTQSQGQPTSGQRQPNQQSPTAIQTAQPVQLGNQQRDGARGGGSEEAEGRQLGRLRVGLTHTILLDQEVILAPGLAPLDPLDGTALSADRGVARHTVQADAGIFYGFVGGQLRVNWIGDSIIRGTDGSVLTFSDRFDVSLRTFLRLQTEIPFVAKNPWLNNVTLFARVNNLTDSVNDVTDENGLTPLAYQPGLLVPQGREFVVGFRKQF